MDDIAITDAPDLDLGGGGDATETAESAPLESAAESTESAETEGESADLGATDTEGQQPQTTTFRAVENGRLNPAAKAVLEKIKAEDPKLYQAVTKALFAEDRLRRELPGGFKDIQALREQIENLGGDAGIEETQNELKGWREFDQLYTAGDAKVLELLMAEPEGKDAFLQIAPAAFEKFREMNPEGFSAYVSQVFVADMQGQQIPLMLERLQDFLPADNPKAQELWKNLAAYVNRIASFAGKPIAAPKQAPAAKDDQRSQQLQQREQELTRKEWGGDLTSRHRNIFSSEWKTQIGARKLSDTQAATVRELYGLRLTAILKAKPEIAKNIERYFSSGQKDNYLKYMESFYKDAAPRALRQAIEQAGVGAKPGPKGTATPVVPKPGQPPVKKPPAAAGGFTPVSKKPDMGTVDRVATTSDLWLSGKAVLKDGTRVAWTR